MDQDNLADYRSHLLKNVDTAARRPRRGATHPLHLFINEQRVGELDGTGRAATLQVQHATPIHTVQVRSEDGILLGGLCAPEHGLKTTRIALGREAIDLDVRNHAEGGTVNAVFSPAAPLWHKVRSFFGGRADGPGWQSAPAYLPGMRTMAFTQALVALVLVGVATDRWTGGTAADRTPPSLTPAQAPWVAPLAEVEKLEHRLTDLMQMQTKAIDAMQTQQQNMVQVQRTIAKLSAAQETVASGVVTVQREIEKREKGVGREVDRMSRLLISRAQNAQEELQAEIHSLTIANDRLSKERLDLERSNQELKQRLKAAGIDVSKLTPSKAGSGDLAQRKDEAPTTQIAEGRRPQGAQPLLFWVTFQDGTSEDSIERLVRELRGRKGSVMDGWQAVEIVHPVESPDRFLDKVRQAKIVKAVRTVEAQ